MTSNLKIAVFGGAHNPITKGHIRLANYIVDYKVADMVFIMPCYKSLYNKELVEGSHRLEMIKLAEKNPNVVAFDWEIKNKIENKGTYEIMKMLEKYFLFDLYFVIGLDNSQKVRKWLNGDKILNELKFIVVPRSNFEASDKWFLEPPHIYLENYSPDAISSTLAKELLATKKDTSSCLDEKVSKYIADNNLYAAY